MSETQKKSKWKKVGSVLVSKTKNEDGTDRLYMKVSNPTVLRENQVLNFFAPDEKAPEWVAFDVATKVD